MVPLVLRGFYLILLLYFIFKSLKTMVLNPPYGVKHMLCKMRET